MSEVKESVFLNELLYTSDHESDSDDNDDKPDPTKLPGMTKDRARLLSAYIALLDDKQITAEFTQTIGKTPIESSMQNMIKQCIIYDMYELAKLLVIKYNYLDAKYNEEWVKIFNCIENLPQIKKLLVTFPTLDISNMFENILINFSRNCEFMDIPEWLIETYPTYIFDKDKVRAVMRKPKKKYSTTAEFENYERLIKLLE